jgi:hypothetical protein
LRDDIQQYFPTIANVDVAFYVAFYLRFNGAKRNDDRQSDEFSGFDVRTGPSLKITKAVGG